MKRKTAVRRDLQKAMAPCHPVEIIELSDSSSDDDERKKAKAVIAAKKAKIQPKPPAAQATMPRPSEITRNINRTPDLAVVKRSAETRPVYYIETDAGTLRETWHNPENFENGPGNVRRRRRRLEQASQQGEPLSEVVQDLTVLEKLKIGMLCGPTGRTPWNYSPKSVVSAVASFGDASRSDSFEQSEWSEMAIDEMQQQQQQQQDHFNNITRPSPTVWELQAAIDASVGLDEFTHLPYHLQGDVDDSEAPSMCHPDVVQRATVPTAYENLQTHFLGEMPFV